MRGLFVRLVVKRLGMVITRWKDSKSLQIAGKVIMSGVGEVQRRSGRDIITVYCPNYVIGYQNNMDGVHIGDQLRMMGTGFANVAHFKKWYKKGLLGIACSSLLQAFTEGN